MKRLQSVFRIPPGIVLILIPFFVNAQNNIHFIKLDTWGRNVKDEKGQNPIAFFEVQHDTIWSYDVEQLQEAIPLKIRKPEGFTQYAYGFVYFSGVASTHSPGMVTLLLCNYKTRNPVLFVDRNNNADFTDDSLPIALPAPYQINDTVNIQLCRNDNPEACIAVGLCRFVLHNKPEYRNLLNEHYRFYYGDRKFIGIDYCFRELRHTLRSGVVRTATDSFRIALYDGNSNGIYDEPNHDVLLVANLQDSVFDNRNELQATPITEKRSDLFFDKNGVQYHLLQMDAAGHYIKLVTPEIKTSIGYEPGKKIPKVKFFDWQGTKRKVCKWRRKEIYFYLTGPDALNFKNDTTYLRKLAHEFSDQLVVVGLIHVNKSYELKIFGTYANLNWIAAYKDKYLLRDLKLQGLPSSLYVGKKFRVKQYGLTPEQLYRKLKP